MKSNFIEIYEIFNNLSEKMIIEFFWEKNTEKCFLFEKKKSFCLVLYNDIIHKF